MVRGVVARRVEWCLDLPGLDHVEHVTQNQCLLFEPRFVLAVSQDHKEILHQGDEVGLIELVLELGVLL